MPPQTSAVGEGDFIHNLGNGQSLCSIRMIFIGTSAGFSSQCGPSPGFHSTKGRRLLFVFLHLARVEENFSVRVSDDYVANLLEIERTGQTMRMDWLFAVWWDCYFQHSDVLILKDDLVSFRRYFHAIQFSGPRAYPLRAIILLSLSRPKNNQRSGDKVRKQCDCLHESLLARLCS